VQCTSPAVRGPRLINMALHSQPGSGTVCCSGAL
jgi:hypothetical protein